MLGSYGEKLCLCDWQVEKHRGLVDNRLKRMLKAEFEEGMSPVIEMAMSQLDEYFAGKRKVFDVPLLFVGIDFQIKVWNDLLNIPYGKTVSYRERWQGTSACRRLYGQWQTQTAQMPCQSSPHATA